MTPMAMTDDLTPMVDNDIKANPWIVPEIIENPNEPQISSGRREGPHHDNNIPPNRRTVNFSHETPIGDNNFTSAVQRLNQD